MNRPSPATEELARRVLAIEARVSAVSPEHAALRAVEKLRLYLATFIGSTGFRAILGRALAMAKTQARWLESVQITGEGALTGFVEAAHTCEANEAREGGLTLLTDLLGLLVVFIGAAITLHMVQEVWSDAGVDDLNSDAEEATG